MKIAIGSDHAGYKYKEIIKAHLTKLGHEVIDHGTDSQEPVDYPIFIKPVAEDVSDGSVERGIVLGGSGNGEAIVANRHRHVRCTLCWNELSTKFARLHNDSNVLSIGQRLVREEDLIKIVDIWLNTEFEGGRHIARLDLIDH